MTAASITRVRNLVHSRHRGALIRAAAGSLRRVAARSGELPALEQHLDVTYRWLCTAQDAPPDAGVAGFFDLWSGRWSGSYPETTGYIIPTFLALAEARADGEAYSRAMRMADWCCEVQLEDGAVRSGVIGTRVGPAVFNTGQGLFGWLSAYEVSGEERYANAARKAAEWLVRQQDPDGAWRRNLSVLTQGPVHTYNGRCAWALAYAAKTLGERRFAEAALAASDWVLRQQGDAGWFAHNGFSEEEAPLLHTVSYVIEGLVGVYAFTGEERFLAAARRALDPIAELARAGRLGGRLDSRWRSVVTWRCPTGEAQIAVVMKRLETHCPSNGYAGIARQLISDIARIQLTLVAGSALTAGARPAAGGVPGSFPIWGQYMRFALPNWAAKFYLDALLLQTAGVDEKSFPRLVNTG